MSRDRGDNAVPLMPNDATRQDNRVVRFDPMQKADAIRRQFADNIFDIWKSKLDWKYEAENIDEASVRLNAFNEYLHRVQLINQHYRDMHIEMHVSPEIADIMAQGQLIQATQAVERQIADHHAYIRLIHDHEEERQVTMDMARAQVLEIHSRMKIEELTAQLTSVRALAEVEGIKADTQLKTIQARLLQAITDSLNFEEITPSQAFVLARALNPQASDQIQSKHQETLLEEQLEAMRAETKRKLQEIRQVKAKSDTDEVAARKTIEEWERG